MFLHRMDGNLSFNSFEDETSSVLIEVFWIVTFNSFEDETETAGDVRSLLH